MANYKLVQDPNGYVFSSEVSRNTGKMSSPLAGSTLKFTYADRTNNTREQANLFSSFRLPITNDQQTSFNSAFNTNYAPTYLNEDIIVVAEIPKNEYGELVDGKTIKFVYATTGGTVDIYGTYSKDAGFLSSMNARTSDPQEELVINGYKLGVSKTDPVSQNVVNPPANNPNNLPYKSNICLLFADDIRRPEGDPALSWATGWGGNATAPYTNGKELYDFMDLTGGTADQPVGVAYLDSGFVVITDPTLTHDIDVSGMFNSDGTPYVGGATNFSDIYYSASTAELYYEDINTEYILSVLCVALPNEFNLSNNGTFDSQVHDTVKITEVALYGEQIDGNGNSAPGELLAYGKTDRPVSKRNSDAVSFLVQIKA